MIWLAVIPSVAFVLVVLAVLGWLQSGDGLVRGLRRRDCLITCKDGSAYRGVLYEADRSSFVLRRVSTVGERGGPVPLDGEVLILRADVAFLQIP